MLNKPNNKLFGTFWFENNIKKTNKMAIILEKTNLPTSARKINNIKKVKQFKYLGTIHTNEVKLNAQIDVMLVLARHQRLLVV